MTMQTNFSAVHGVSDVAVNGIYGSRRYNFEK